MTGPWTEAQSLAGDRDRLHAAVEASPAALVAVLAGIGGVQLELEDVRVVRPARGERPGVAASDADGDERPPGDLHAGDLEAGAVEPHLVVDLGRAVAHLRTAQEQRLPVRRHPRAEDDGVRHVGPAESDLGEGLLRLLLALADLARGPGGVVGVAPLDLPIVELVAAALPGRIGGDRARVLEPVGVGEDLGALQRSQACDEVAVGHGVVELVGPEPAEAASQQHVDGQRVVHGPRARGHAERGILVRQLARRRRLRDPAIHAGGERLEDDLHVGAGRGEQAGAAAGRPEQGAGLDIAGERPGAEPLRERPGRGPAERLRLPEAILPLGPSDAVEERRQGVGVQVGHAVLVSDDRHLGVCRLGRTCGRGSQQQQAGSKQSCVWHVGPHGCRWDTGPRKYA